MASDVYKAYVTLRESGRDHGNAVRVIAQRLGVDRGTAQRTVRGALKAEEGKRRG